MLKIKYEDSIKKLRESVFGGRVIYDHEALEDNFPEMRLMKLTRSRSAFLEEKISSFGNIEEKRV